jgi:hypothetical protein
MRETHDQTFPRDLLTSGLNAKAAYFHSVTIAHPFLKEAKDQLMNAIEDADPDSLIFVYGPTGVGKSTLRTSVANTVIKTMLPELELDRGRIPIVSFELAAPGPTHFNWTDNFQRLLYSMAEPLVDCKVAPRTDPSNSKSFRVRVGRRSAADYRYAYEQALDNRRPVAALLDDAQYLAKAPGARLLDQLDVVKSIASHTKVPHVLFGTYDLLSLRNLSGQISRRSIDIHLPRYTFEKDDDEIFANVAMSFALAMPVESCPEFDGEVDYLLERSGGCVGVLKTWLEQSLKEALRSGDSTVTRKHLEKRSYSNTALTKLFMEIAEGEERLSLGASDYSIQRKRLVKESGSDAEKEKKAETQKEKISRKFRPGQRNPSRSDWDALLDRASNLLELPRVWKATNLPEIYETWLSHEPCIPARSELYSLEPIEIGGPLVEGLTGYLSRLSYAHSLAVSDLLDLEVLPTIESEDRSHRFRRRYFLAQCHLLDGSESLTSKWVDALQGATFQNGLQSLTLFPYTKITEHSWVRRKRAWCPRCYQDWREDGRIVYEPLIWSVKVVSVCPVHKISMVDICSHCYESCAPLVGRSSPGHCGRCRGWLGTYQERGAQRIEADYKEEYLIWCAEQIGLLVAATPRFKIPFERGTVSKGLSAYVQSLLPVSMHAISQLTSCSARSLELWKQGISLPRIESLCRLCFELGISLLDLVCGLKPDTIASATRGLFLKWDKPPRKGVKTKILRQNSLSLKVANTSNMGEQSMLVSSKATQAICESEFLTGEPHQITRPVPLGRQSAARKLLIDDWLQKALEKALVTDPPVSPQKVAMSLGYLRPCRVLLKFPDLCLALESRVKQPREKQRSLIRETLERALSEWPPPTLNELAHRCGVVGTGRLRRQDTLLCDRLISRRRGWIENNNERVEAMLRRALDQDEIQPIRQFCKTNRISIDLVISRFPELKDAFHRRYRSSKQAKRLQERERFDGEILRIVRVLKERSEHPTRGSVLEENPGLKSGGWERIKNAINMALAIA